MLKHYRKNKVLFRMLFLFVSIAVIIPGAAYSGSFDNVPAKGTITMVDLGAKKCIPCKMMAPIIEKLETLYKGKAAIIFIDVWENREQAPRFGINAIPTQIFFDKEGKEVFRHVGFLGEDQIKAQLKKMGVEPPPEPEKK